MNVLEYLVRQLRSQPVPPAVYHYTSASGLLGIVREAKIRATDLQFLNDSREFEYGAVLMRNLIETHRVDAEFVSDMPCLDEFVRGMSAAHRIRMFVTSFASDGNQLSQWRAYCPSTGGYSIGFEPEALMEAAGAILAPCVYEWSEQVALCEGTIEVVLEQYRQQPSGTEAKDHLTRCGADFFSAFLFLAAFLKDPGFSEESEWRLVTRGELEGTTAPLFREGRSGLVPYVELPLRLDEKPLTLKTVIVGPNPHVQLARQTAEALLRSYGVAFEDVAASGIPFRSW